MEQKGQNYNEGCSMQRPPLLESDGFCYWKQRFETYVCAKDIELWERIETGDYVPNIWSSDTNRFMEVDKKSWTSEHKQKVAKNYEAKLILYNSLPRKEYERVFMCKSASEAWKTLIVTHQGNAQVIESKIDLLVGQYEQFAISNDEKIDVGYSRFNTICTSLKSLGTEYTNKQCVRKFLRALPPKWRPKVTAIDEAKDFEKLTLDELVGNLKVHEAILEKDEEIEKLKKEKYKSIALKAKKSFEPPSDEEKDDDSFEGDDEEMACMVRNFKKFFRRGGKFVRPPTNDFRRPQFDDKKKVIRKCFNCGDPSHMINDCPKKKERAYVGGAWDDEEGDSDEPQEKCLVVLNDHGSSSGAWSDSDDDDSNICLVGQDENEVSSTSDYSIDLLEVEYDKLVSFTSRINDKNKMLKQDVTLLKQELEKQKKLFDALLRENEVLKNKSCSNCKELKQEIATLKGKTKGLEKELYFHKFEKSSEALDKMLEHQRSSDNKGGLGYVEKFADVKISPTIFVKKVETETEVSRGRTQGRIVRPCVRPATVQRPKIIRSNQVIQRHKDVRISPNMIERPKNLNRFYPNKTRNYSPNYYHKTNWSSNYGYKRIVQKWVKIGMFTTNNPGPMKHWVPSS